MKNNWATYITITMLLFMTFIGVLVVKTYSVNTELVSEDYYKQEIAYQSKIDNMANLKHDTATVSHVFTDSELVLSFPKSAKGTIEFYRPSDASKDLIVPLQLSMTNEQAFRKELFIKGLYKMKLDWESDGKRYYMEEDLMMP
jgi:hypothetical protein